MTPEEQAVNTATTVLLLVGQIAEIMRIALCTCPVHTQIRQTRH